MTDGSLTLTIRLTSSVRFDIGSCGSITPQSTIQHIKELISQRDESDRCSVDRQRLIHKGRILSDNTRTLSDYGIGANPGETPVLYLVKSNAGSGGSAPAGGSGAATTSSSAPAPAPAAPPANPFANFGNSNASNPMAGMFGAGGGMPDLASMQRQLQENPQMMQDMMNNPMVQSLMSNPDFMSNIFESNPQMRAIMDSNPELRNALRDPEFMRRQMEMMRDPNAMQNMMRNQDLAMSQIENMPGGFNALRSMYENIQEPMMDAMAGGDGNSGTTGNTSNPSNSRAGASNQAMPNPWGSPAAAPAAPANAGGAAAANPFASMMSNMNLNSPAAGGAAANPWAAMANPAAQPNSQNLEATIQMLENPAMQQMMEQAFSNPELMRQMMNTNPMLQQLRQTNPQAAAIFDNPDAMRNMMNPQNLRAMVQMQQAMQQLGGSGLFGGMPQPPSAASAPSAAAGGLDFSSLLGSGAGSTAASAGMPPMNPFMFPFGMPPAGGAAQGIQGATGQPASGQRFRVQLQNLQDMGFSDRSANISALTASNGNVNRAIEILLESPPEMGDSAAADSAAEAEASGDNNNAEAERSGESATNEEPKGSAEKKND